MKHILKFAAVASLATLLLGACKKDTPQPTTPTDIFTTDPKELFFEAVPSEEQIVVVATPDPDWTPSVTVDWLTVDKESSSTLKVSAAETAIKDDRFTEITLTSSDGKSSHKITVKQYGLNTVTTIAFLNGETEALLAARNANAQISFLPDPLLSRTVIVDLTKTSSFTMQGQETAASWLTATRDGNRITFTVPKYEQSIDRSVDITFTTGVGDEKKTVVLTVSQKGSGPHFETMLSGGIPAKNVSPNGRYVVGTLGGRSWILDRANETFYQVGSGSGAVDDADYTKGITNLYAVTDEGVAVGSAYQVTSTYYPCTFSLKTKSFTWLDKNITVDEHPDTAPTSGNAWDISSDGRTIVGFMAFPRGTEPPAGTLEQVMQIPMMYYAVMWRDGVLTKLGYLPKGLETDPTRGFVATMVSADGSRAAGYLSTRLSNSVACTWDLSQPTNVPEIILKDNADYFHQSNQTFEYGPDTEHTSKVDILQPDLYCEVQNISKDGSLLAVTRHARISDSEWTYTPFVYNTASKQVVMRSDNTDGLPSMLMHDGTLVYVTPHNTTARQTYFWNGSSAPLLMSDYMQAKHELKVPTVDSAGKEVYFQLQNISDDGKTIVGFNTGTGFTTAIISL